MQQRYRIKRTVQPTAEPVTVAEALEHVRADSTAEAAYVGGLISLAREWIEDHCNVTLITTTWQLTLDEFPYRVNAASCHDRYAIDLPRCPVASITSVAYVDADGATQTLSDSLYALDNASDVHASVGPAFNQVWPADVRDHPGSVAVVYVAGYPLAASVPAPFRHAIKLLIGHLYENREASLTGTISKEIEFSVTSLIEPRNLTPIG